MKEKLQLFKEKILDFKGKEEMNTEPWEEKTNKKVGCKVAVASLGLACLLVGTTLGINEAIVDHSNEMCLAAKVISVFDKESAINHQMGRITDNYVGHDVSVDYAEAKYVAPQGYTLEDNGRIAVKRVDAIPRVVYTLPSGYTLTGNKGIKYQDDGTKEVIDATRNVFYSAPIGAVLETYEGKVYGVYYTEPIYAEDVITSVIDGVEHNLVLKK